MDLTLFHYNKDGDYYWKDKLNGRTGRLRCGYLEWIGWYNWDILQRLLGHYRLFQIYKKNRLKTGVELSLIRSYILQYQSTHAMKYFVSKIVGILHKPFTKGPYLLVEMEGMNRMLITDRSDILADFLVHADEDFKLALETATQKIQNAEFFVPIIPTINIVNPAPAKGLKGKEEGVFSKKQILILFDLLSGSENFEKIDFRKPNKHAALAELFHAITGREKSAFMDALKDYKNHSLYRYDTPGQFNELKGTILNLAERFENAGFNYIADLAYRKIKELDSANSNQNSN